MFGRSHTSKFELCPLPGPGRCSVTLQGCRAGTGGPAPVSPAVTRVNRGSPQCGAQYIFLRCFHLPLGSPGHNLLVSQGAVLNAVSLLDSSSSENRKAFPLTLPLSNWTFTSNLSATCKFFRMHVPPLLLLSRPNVPLSLLRWGIRVHRKGLCTAAIPKSSIQQHVSPDRGLSLGRRLLPLLRGL